MQVIMRATGRRRAYTTMPAVELTSIDRSRMKVSAKMDGDLDDGDRDHDGYGMDCSIEALKHHGHKLELEIAIE
jgi:hypothetical protein